MGAEAGAFLGHGLLDLDDHLGRVENFCGIGADLCAGGFVVGVAGADAEPRAGLDVNGMAVSREFAHRTGGQANPVFVILGFPGNADFHDLLRGWMVGRYSG